MTLLHPYARRTAQLFGIAALAAGGIAAPATAADSTSDTASTARHDHRQSITVFGHRGAAGHRPEHTLAGYELAIRLGATTSSPIS